MPLRRATAVLLALAAGLAAGCKGSGRGATSDDVVLSASSPEVFLGERVELTVTLGEAAGGEGVAAWLVASEPGVLQLPAFVYVEPDETEATVEAFALAPSGAPVTVTADAGDTASVTLSVLAHPSITLVATVGTADQLSTGMLSWSGTATHARGIDAELAEVSVAAGSGVTLGDPVLMGDESGFTLEVGYEIAVDAPPGVVEIDVDTNGGDIGGYALESLAIRRIPRVAALDPPVAIVDTTEIRPFLVTLDEPARNGGELVVLASDEAGIADPGTEVTVDAGELTAIVMVEGIAAGGPVGILATLADSDASSVVTVADATVGALDVVSNTAFQSQTVTVMVTGTGSSPVAVDDATFSIIAPMGSGLTLANESLAGDEDGWTLTFDVTVDADAPSGLVQLSLDANGAGVPGAIADVPFTVLGLPRVISLDPSPATIPHGEFETFTVTLNLPARTGGENVVVTSATGGVLSFTSPVVVPEGMTTANFDVTGSQPGETTLTASLNGGTEDALVTVTAVQLGDVVITEFVTLTADTSGNAGEAIEIRNVSGGPVAINGWTLETLSDGPFSIRSALTPDDDTTALILTDGAIAFGVPNIGTIPPGAAFVWGPASTTAQVGNDGDALRLRDDAGGLQDELDFTAFVKDPGVYPGANDFPAYSQKSTQLDGDEPADALTNDDGGRWCVTFRAASTLGLANQPCVATVINEILYDATSTDGGKTFVELAGPGGASLDAHVVRQVTDSGVVFGPVAITAGRRVPVDGFYLIADLTSGMTSVAGADQTDDSVDPQNGPGDAVQLVLDLGASRFLLDAVRYGTVAGGSDVDDDDLLPIVEGTSCVDPGEGSSVGRDALSTDSDDNSVDFTADTTPTPGAPNS